MVTTKSASRASHTKRSDEKKKELEGGGSEEREYSKKDSYVLDEDYKLEEFEGVLPSSKHPQVINRQEYELVFVKGSDEKTINTIQGSGRSLGTLRWTSNTIADEDDEIIFLLKK